MGQLLVWGGQIALRPIQANSFRVDDGLRALQLLTEMRALVSRFSTFLSMFKAVASGVLKNNQNKFNKRLRDNIRYIQKQPHRRTFPGLTKQHTKMPLWPSTGGKGILVHLEPRNRVGWLQMSFPSKGS